jgi:hypothetical protein
MPSEVPLRNSAGLATVQNIGPEAVPVRVREAAKSAARKRRRGWSMGLGNPVSVEVVTLELM